MTYVLATPAAASPPADPIDMLTRCEQVTLLEHTATQGRLEISGLDAFFAVGDLGLCVGIDLDVDDFPPWWLEQTTLWLASTLDAADDAISQIEGRWMIWRRYERSVSASDLDDSIERHIALARYLGETCPAADRE
ncbi:hypothetical protein [Cupriavidus pampae]|uniref:hypothetical protein n=1 Tax=Cupriavidus pampae TaxID=659251 RepID=UPI001CC5A5D3|nr:hypothetical protein [Cupriavidus pampae]